MSKSLTVEGKIFRRRSSIPVSYRGNYDRAMSGKSMKCAIKAMCLECMGWDREEVRLCCSPACPLYPYRPFVADKLKRSVRFRKEPASGWFGRKGVE